MFAYNYKRIYKLVLPTVDVKIYGFANSFVIFRAHKTPEFFSHLENQCSGSESGSGSNGSICF
jgi:hypothetical protein